MLVFGGRHFVTFYILFYFSMCMFNIIIEHVAIFPMLRDYNLCMFYHLGLVGAFFYNNNNNII